METTTNLVKILKIFLIFSGTACGKLHQVSLMSIIDPGDSDILQDEEEEK